MISFIRWTHVQKSLLKESLPEFKEKAKEDNKEYMYHELHFNPEEVQWELLMYVRDNNRKELVDG